MARVNTLLEDRATKQSESYRVVFSSTMSRIKQGGCVIAPAIIKNQTHLLSIK